MVSRRRLTSRIGSLFHTTSQTLTDRLLLQINSQPAQLEPICVHIQNKFGQACHVSLLIVV
jgi:hypothetical protein